MKTKQLVRAALLAVVALAFACALSWRGDAQGQAQPRWWKGNLHTHSLWSDGDDYPEMIADWYRGHGYQFLALSDHNTLQQGERWIDVAKSRGGMAAFERYRARFGADWVESRTRDGVLEARLKRLDEFRGRFEARGRFLLIQSEEITDKYGNLPVHINATNLSSLIRPRGGDSVREVMQNNVDAVMEQRAAIRQPMFPHLNHPNFGWGVTAEDLAAVRGERFFEVYNGHPGVRNYGDDRHASTERVWDIALSLRLSRPEGEPLYGVGVDDAHNYHEMAANRSNPGRGWVMVRATELTPAAIVAAMEAGDFYASSGVTLRRVERRPNRLSLAIDTAPGVEYVTRFYGTRRGFDAASRAVRGEDGQPLYATRVYGEGVGALLAETRGASASYTLRGDELYVRAVVTSSKLKENPYAAGDFEAAWVQPVIPPAPQENAAAPR